jgi:lipopolysaccharide transport system ATP-binding protein
MNVSEIAISVRGLGKSYTIAHDTAKHVTLAESMLHRFRHPFQRQQKETFWALNDVSFDIKKGDVVGIIGRNGAGKSTLLKILSRITEPTQGEIDLYGRIGSLLEVGTGFHPELTGRENIYLNGHILGMRKKEIDKQFDAIVDFSGVETFLDTPVKRYSSGMYVRLAFAVAAHLESEILIIDEVLAVGDAEFQRKCLGKMKDVAADGRTVLFVSHNMMAVQQLCNAGIYLNCGQVEFAGSVDSCIQEYLEGGASGGSEWRRDEAPNKPLSFDRVKVRLAGEQPHHRLEIDVRITSRSAHKPAFVAVDLLEPGGTSIMQAIPTLERFIHDDRNIYEFLVLIDLPPMVPGRYWLTLWSGFNNSETADMVSRCVNFEVNETPTLGRTFPHTSDHGYIVPNSRVLQLTRATGAGSVPVLAGAGR